jgi:hypothetical protein
MKSSTHLLFAAAMMSCAGLLPAQDPEPPKNPPAENPRFVPSSERPENAAPNLPREERARRQNDFLPPGGARPGDPNRIRRDREEGDRLPPGASRPGNFPHRDVVMQPQPYLGVVTRLVPPELSAQLKLPEGFGLVVEDVLDDSPAKAAGVRKNDLLRMLDDQLIVNQPQLEALVRRAGKDKEVSLTLMREGSEQKVPVKVGEKSLPVRRPLNPANIFQDQFRDQFSPRDNPRQSRDGYRPPNDIRGQPGAGAPLDRQTHYATERARVMRRDDSGTYEIQHVEGHRILTARRHDGTQIWKGPVDTEAERKAMPDEVRQKFEEIEKSRPLDRLGNRPGQAPLPKQPEPPPGNRAPEEVPAPRPENP